MLDPQDYELGTEKPTFSDQCAEVQANRRDCEAENEALRAENLELRAFITELAIQIVRNQP